MSKTFRPWNVDQVWLFPPSVQDFVPAKHAAHFVRETVRTQLDLTLIFASYEEERGYPPYHPTMMVALLLYVCLSQITSGHTDDEGHPRSAGIECGHCLDSAP